MSYTTECPETIYRIEIVCRRYKSTLKCFQSPHRHTGTSKMAGAQTSKWNDVTWSYSSAQKKQTSPTLGPRFLVKFPRVGKAKTVNRRPVDSVGRELGFCAGGLGFNPPPRPTLRVFIIHPNDGKTPSKMGCLVHPSLIHHIQSP